MPYGSAPVAGLIPTAFIAAEGAVSGDPLSLIMQLGVGGVLVGFAVWLQDKFSTTARRDVDNERERHDITRAQLIEALKESRPPVIKDR